MLYKKINTLPWWRLWSGVDVFRERSVLSVPPFKSHRLNSPATCDWPQTYFYRQPLSVSRSAVLSFSATLASSSLHQGFILRPGDAEVAPLPLTFYTEQSSRGFVSITPAASLAINSGNIEMISHHRKHWRCRNLLSAVSNIFRLNY